MATIFQLRRGSNPASPTLVEGELYLNNAKGTIQFGSGSTVAPYDLLAMNVPMVGNVDLYGNFSASIPKGYVWVGDANNRTILAATSSFGGGGSVTAVSDTSGQIGIDLTLSAGTLSALASGLTTSSDVQFNSIGIGTAPTTVAGEIRATGDIVAFYSSDERLKENIQPIENALTKVEMISGNTYDWKEGFETIHSHKGNDIGVIAQEIEKVLPQAVTERETGYKAVNYEKIVPLLIEAIKELNAKIDKLENK
jgi:hypothetical protein